MLILTRRVGERILIGDDIVLTITRINGMQVVIGIDAPRDVTIMREEIAGMPKRKTSSEYVPFREEDYNEDDCENDE